MHDNILVKSYIESLKGLVEVDVVYGSKRDIILQGRFSSLIGGSEFDILNRIAMLPGKPEIICVEPKVVVRITMPGKVSIRKVPWLNIVLFILTLFSTLLVGAGNAGTDFVNNPEMFWTDPWKIILAGMPFSFPLLGILLFHEFGHYIASRLHNVKVSLPYFIPFPNIIGTMGAVIRSKSPFITRIQLFDVGAAGPLAGMVVAIPVVIWGLAHPVFITETPDISGLFYLGDSLLFTLISWLVHPPTPDGYIAVLSQTAFAGWVGFLVTMLNLLPIGQLDGGHVMYAMFGKIQRKIAYAALLALVVLSFYWTGWILWALLGFFLIKPAHPPTVLDEIPLDKRRMAIGYLCIVVFVLCFMPVPIVF
ncbi:MAG: site-2 protease family protein [candidate division Zixibacteria bacterium]|nr:site-2 protease family protein [candidate division Zixibacteria bacterium]